MFGGACAGGGCGMHPSYDSRMFGGGIYACSGALGTHVRGRLTPIPRKMHLKCDSRMFGGAFYACSGAQKPSFTLRMSGGAFPISVPLKNNGLAPACACSGAGSRMSGGAKPWIYACLGALLRMSGGAFRACSGALPIRNRNVQKRLHRKSCRNPSQNLRKRIFGIDLKGNSCQPVTASA